MGYLWVTLNQLSFILRMPHVLFTYISGLHLKHHKYYVLEILKLVIFPLEICGVFLFNMYLLRISDVLVTQ